MENLNIGLRTGQLPRENFVGQTKSQTQKHAHSLTISTLIQNNFKSQYIEYRFNQIKFMFDLFALCLALFTAIKHVLKAVFAYKSGCVDINSS